MIVRYFPNKQFREGDLVTLSTDSDAAAYCIIGFRPLENGEIVAVLKGLFGCSRVIEAPLGELTNLIVQGRL